MDHGFEGGLGGTAAVILVGLHQRYPCKRLEPFAFNRAHAGESLDSLQGRHHRPFNLPDEWLEGLHGLVRFRGHLVLLCDCPRESSSGAHIEVVG